MADALNRTATYAFDAANRLTAITDPLNHTTTIVLDAAGQRSTVTDPLNRVTTYTYTSRGWVSSVTNPAGDRTTYAYNAAGDVTQISGLRGGPSQTPGSPETTTMTYSTLHQLSTRQDPAGNTTSFVYDQARNQTKITDPLGHSGTMAYDADNRLTSQTDAAGDTTQFAYDQNGNRTSMTDPLLRVTSYGFDARNRMTTITDARGGVTSYTYDFASRQTGITDSVGNTTSYLYDAANELTKTTNPLGSTTYAYDLASQRTSMTDNDGRRTSFAFDAAGRLTTETWVNGNYTATYGYDAANEVTSATDPNSTYAYTYDGAGRIASVDNNGTPNAPRVVLTYSYDHFGNRTSLTDNLNGSIAYSYDTDNRLTSASMTLSSTQGPQITLAYDPASRLTGVTRFVTSSGASISSVFSYDQVDRLTGITHTSSSAGALATYTYGYDAASQQTIYTGPEGTLTYTYDKDGELTAVGDARSESYSYDANGNRNSSGYTTGSDNELTADSNFTYAYDAQGNLTSRTAKSGGQITTFTYDFHNRLTEVLIKSGSTTVQDDKLTYDVNGMRIGKSTFSGGQQWFAYSGQNTYADFNSSGSLTERYLYGNTIDSLYARFDGTNAAWYLTDKLGSVRQLSQTSGTVLDTLTYDSYGNILSESSSSNGDRFKWTSREWDSEISLQFNRARYYNPADGRWENQAPEGVGGGELNLYGYVFNRPVAVADPTGHPVTIAVDLDNGPPAPPLLPPGTVIHVPPIPPLHQRMVPCPCTIDDLQSLRDAGFMVIEDNPDNLDLFHPGAAHGFRIIAPGETAGNQCNYDGAGDLITVGPGAGTPDFFSPQGLWGTGLHTIVDVLPFLNFEFSNPGFGWVYYHGAGVGWEPYSDPKCHVNWGNWPRRRPPKPEDLPQNPPELKPVVVFA
jgi:RHS repeat-associated protein